MAEHHINCDYWCDQYPQECTCGATAPRASWFGRESEIAARRFGSDHDKPCKRAGVLTCAMWKCQEADCCQFENQ